DGVLGSWRRSRDGTWVWWGWEGSSDGPIHNAGGREVVHGAEGLVAGVASAAEKQLVTLFGGQAKSIKRFGTFFEAVQHAGPTEDAKVGLAFVNRVGLSPAHVTTAVMVPGVVVVEPLGWKFGDEVANAHEALVGVDGEFSVEGHECGSEVGRNGGRGRVCGRRSGRIWGRRRAWLAPS